MKPLSFLSVLLTVALSSCSHSTEPVPDNILLDASVNGKSLSYPSNQPFSVVLDVYADAGFQWDYTITNPAVVVSDRAPEYRQKNPGSIVPGGATVVTLYFRTTGKGECSVVLVQHQGWMKDVPPIATVQFSLTVQ